MSIREQLSDERKLQQQLGLLPKWVTTDGWERIFGDKKKKEGDIKKPKLPSQENLHKNA